MIISVSADIVLRTRSEALQSFRESAERNRSDYQHQLDITRLEDRDLREVASAAHDAGDGKTERAVMALLEARAGKTDAVVPNFKAFHGQLVMHLQDKLIDGWVYLLEDDGHHYPYLVTSISYVEERYNRNDSPPRVVIRLAAYGIRSRNSSTDSVGVTSREISIVPGDVSRRRVSDAMAGLGLFHETQELREAHRASLDRHMSLVDRGFGKQFRVNGKSLSVSGSYRDVSKEITNRRVIHDLHQADHGALASQGETELVPSGHSALPRHPVMLAFDLKTHEHFWVHSDSVEPYVYDKKLGDKLVLPASHRDLLDVLTTDLQVFSTDIVEGKSAGNVILCKGVPGVGKTLTAEVYAELIEAPLYSVHSGALGTSAREIAENLRNIFERVKAWGCPLLLDEADVFVMTRGVDAHQNAIVAEFLRALEYFDGLMFMTTNRADDIDEAIISRCAAIIGYDLPGRDHAAQVWRVMARHNAIDLGDELIARLLDMFPKIAPRDIKMLLRLALRVAKKHEEPLSADLFRRCAMFRAIEIAPD